MPDEKDAAQERIRTLQEKIPIGIYQHYKGPLYTVFALSVKEDTIAPMVHYYSHDHKTRWTRDLADFDGVVPDHGKRFKHLRGATVDELLNAVGLTLAVTVVSNPHAKA